jgi:phospholipase C
MSGGLANIDHVVVVMLENRSFDNLLGWLYEPARPPRWNYPPKTPADFAGLAYGSYSNRLTVASQPVPVSHPPTAWSTSPNPYVIPTPDPNETFDNVTTQLFGTPTPPPGAMPTMDGFLQDYATAKGVPSDAAPQIMETFGPNDANVINDLARAFAVSDRWFASVPSQTWPNRGFVHTGSSDGHLNNDDYELYDIPTVFNALEAAGKSWGVFHDTVYLPSLTLGQFMPRLLPHDDGFHPLREFKRRCRAAVSADPAKKLPQYSFVEPRFQAELGWFRVHYPNDYHPPHDVSRGEAFLAEVYGAVRASPCRDRILLIITFDEHGGCYDHVPPPDGSVTPDPGGVSRDGSFKFNRFGVRVPTIVVSSYVQPGTVFRSAGEVPFDHASILATIRDWLGLGTLLTSPRIAQAPTLAGLFSPAPNADWPDIRPTRQPPGEDTSLETPLSDIQKAVVASHIRYQARMPGHPTAVAEAKSQETYRDALRATAPPSRKWLWRLRGVI